jgi:hypothetical protein
MAFRPEDLRPLSAPISGGSSVDHTCAGQGFVGFHPPVNTGRLTCLFSDLHDLFVIVSAESVLESVVVLLAEGALTFAVQVQEVAKVLCEIVDRVYGELDPEVRGVGVGDWDL